MSVVANELTQLLIGTSNPAATLIAQVLAIKPPGGEVTKVATTVLGATMKTSRPGKIPDAGEVTFKLQFDPTLAGHTAISALVTTPVTKWWRVKYVGDGNTTPAVDDFQGYVTKFEPNESDPESENNLEADVTIQVTGAVTRTVGTP